MSPWRETHEVANQVPSIEAHDAFGADAWLQAAVARAGVSWVAGAAHALGTYVGSPEAHHHATLANRFTPELHTHDSRGRRVDVVEYHPSYHVLMNRAFAAGVHSLAWKRGEGGFPARAALFYLWNQLEQGTACPVTMTFASVAVMDQCPDLAAGWRPKVLADAYDPRPEPVTRKSGATIGMAMTEKQGGSDLRAISTVAARDGEHWRLTGHKWFCSAPMSDGFFTLARTDEGVSCLFVPRSLPDGSRNPFLIQRLKDKVGNRSNASSEIEYRGTFASHLIGEPGRGIAALISMAHHTRFDIVVGVAAMMRAAFNQALHHARHRSAFGKALAEQPLMLNVLADLALESEAALLLAFRLAAAFDAAPRDAGERELQRALTPVAKYWLCKRMVPVATEAMECLGGNGYVEESALARLYREAPLNGIWEGSANVICLDALRAFAKSAGAIASLRREVLAGGDARITSRFEAAVALLADAPRAEAQARHVLESFALCLQASLMRQQSSPQAAEAFCASRLAGCARAFGALELDRATLQHLVGRAALGAVT